MAGDIDFEAASESQATVSETTYEAQDPFLMLYTSGTTGKAKGLPVPLRALSSFHSYMVNGIDLRPADVYWNVGDPGWGYGLWYGIIGPLLLGHGLLMRAGRFDPVETIRTLVRAEVTNLAGRPASRG